MSSPLRVLALTRYSRLGASSRVRSYQYVPALRELGIDVEIAPLLGDEYLLRYYGNQQKRWLQIFRDYLRRLVKLSAIGRLDLLWIEKELFPNFPGWFEQALSALKLPYAVDYDDAIFHRYELSTRWSQRLLAHKIDKVMRGAAIVLCGNPYLAERAQRVGSRRVEVIPTVIDRDAYQPAVPKQRERLIIGWIGTPHTATYLNLVSSALRSLATKYAVKLRVIGAKFDIPGVIVECREWSEQSEVGEIQDFDIGIMPLSDSPWERGKCGYKLIQYMGCGLPVVASPVGVNQQIVTNGENGYLAASSSDWTDHLSSLCADGTARRQMGTNGRLLVEQSYSLQAVAPRLASLFHEVAKSKYSAFDSKVRI